MQNTETSPLGTTRVPFFVAFLRLYGSDALFRSSLDFALIGLVVCWFMAPPLLPQIWPKQANDTSRPSASPLHVPQPAPAPAADLTGIAKAANASPVPTGPEKVRREWFRLSDPQIVPALSSAADEITKGSGAGAEKILAEINKPDDPNVLSMSAYAALLMRNKDSMQRAFDLHLKAAIAGHPESMDQVGQFLRLGAAGRVDLAAAVDWYERGAAAGSSFAATNAGRAYVNGWARPIDLTKAHRYYGMAAEAGEPWGMHNYGGSFVNGEGGVTRDAKLDREWIGKAAKAGLAAAQLNYAKLARKGIGGPLDTDEFVEWAHKAAAQGYPPALYELGMFYLEPDAKRAPDVAQAASYLRQAAIKKHPAAQFAYATLCERGAGVAANNVQAFVYYSLAFRAGQKEAQSRLDNLRGKMSATDLETAQRLVSAAT